MNTVTLLKNHDFSTDYFIQDLYEKENVLIEEKLKTVFKEEEIKYLLNFYKEEYIYLKSVEIKDKIFYFTFKKFTYPFFKTDVKHLTREQTIAFVTQAAYFFGIINNLYDNNRNYRLDKFYDYVKNEKLGFTDINIKYRQFTENKENTVLIFNSINYRKFNDKIFGEIQFELEKYCTGFLKFFIEV